MSAHAQALPAPTIITRRSSFRRWTEREAVFSWLMIIPPMLFLLALVGYPFVYGIWLSLEARPVAKPGVFIGRGFAYDISPEIGACGAAADRFEPWDSPLEATHGAVCCLFCRSGGPARG